MAAAGEGPALEVLKAIQTIAEVAALVGVQLAVGGGAHVLFPEHVGIRVKAVLVLVNR